MLNDLQRTKLNLGVTEKLQPISIDFTQLLVEGNYT
jgi:hypothetical protein